MAVILWIYGILFKKVNRYLAAIVAVLLNGVAAPAMLMLLPSLGMAFIAAMVLPLTVGSLINVLVALIVHASLERVEVIKRMKVFSFGE
jgi:predicted membrane protein